MNCTVFYSWQSDLPNRTNRGFIQKALENAAKAIREDDSILVEPRIDRDTSGVAGSPDIGMTIFDKIEKAHVFVCDLSLINPGAVYVLNEGGALKIDLDRSPRLTPNPNVLLELGYALKVLSNSRVLMVFNTAYGKTEDLPFDLRTKRVITYAMPDEPGDRATERKKLESVFEDGLRAILAGVIDQTVGEEIKPKSKATQAIEAIESEKPTQAYLTRQFMEELTNRLNVLKPDYSSVPPAEYDEVLVKSLEQSVECVGDLARVAETIAIMGSSVAAVAMCKGFEGIAQGYNTPAQFSGSYLRIDFDFHKFVGHELFVTFVSFLIREEQWNVLTDVLDQELIIRNSDGGRRNETHRYSYLSQYVELLDHRNQRLGLRKVSLHGHILNIRHTEGPLASFVPMEQFVDADYFLFLRGFQEEYRFSDWSQWRPWSVLYLNRVPSYIKLSVRRKNAEQLLAPLGLTTTEAPKPSEQLAVSPGTTNIERLQHLLSVEAPKIADLFSGASFFTQPLYGFDVKAIASR